MRENFIITYFLSRIPQSDMRVHYKPPENEFTLFPFSVIKCRNNDILMIYRYTGPFQK